MENKKMKPPTSLVNTTNEIKQGGDSTSKQQPAEKK
jgi:hypothetical protein